MCINKDQQKGLTFFVIWNYFSLHTFVVDSSPQFLSFCCFNLLFFHMIWLVAILNQKEKKENIRSVFLFSLSFFFYSAIDATQSCFLYAQCCANTDSFSFVSLIVIVLLQLFWLIWLIVLQGSSVLFYCHFLLHFLMDLQQQCNCFALWFLIIIFVFMFYVH